MEDLESFENKINLENSKNNIDFEYINNHEIEIQNIITHQHSWRNKKIFKKDEYKIFWENENHLCFEQSKQYFNSEQKNHLKIEKNSKLKKQYYPNNKPKKLENKSLSHFINIPVLDHNFIEKYINFSQNIILSHGKKNILDFFPELLQKPSKLHMTICVLDLGQDIEKIELVHKLLSELSSQISNIAKGSLNFNFESYDTMGSEKSARVIYAKMIEDENFHKLSEIIHLIIKTLVENNILDKNKLSDLHIKYDHKDDKYRIKLHMTLLNVLFLNKVLKKNHQKPIYNINAYEILGYMKERILPSAKITEIHFSKMREDKITEKYELLHSYKI